MMVRRSTNLAITFLVFALSDCNAFYIRLPKHQIHCVSVFSYSTEKDSIDDDKDELTVSQAIQNRYACKSFERYDGASPDNSQASPPNPQVLEKAWQCLDLARLSPSSFNTQPYRVILVHSAAQKLALSRACLGPNARRVLNSDCTAVFLADKQVLRDMPLFNRDPLPQGPPRGRRPLFYIALFSSGYPLPRILAATLGFLVRTAMSWLDIFTGKIWKFPLPTLSSSETWATKQTSLVAMSYMLACTSRGLATIPMEGLNAAGIRRALGIPRRFAIPMIVATGRPAHVKKEVVISNDSTRDANAVVESRRYPAETMIFGDQWGEKLSLGGA